MTVGWPVAVSAVSSFVAVYGRRSHGPWRHPVIVPQTDEAGARGPIVTVGVVRVDPLQNACPFWGVCVGPDRS